jgi:hypothetical protein
MNVQQSQKCTLMPGSKSPEWGNWQRVDVMQPLQHQLVSVLGDKHDDDDHDYDDKDTECNFSIGQPDDDNLSSDYSTIDTVAKVYNDVLDNDDAAQHHQEAFCRMYLQMYCSMQEGMHHINDNKYNELVDLLSHPPKNRARMTERNNRK